MFTTRGVVLALWRSPGISDFFWPASLAAEIKGLNVYSLSYPAAASRWLGKAMPLEDRAVNVLECLLSEPGLSQGSISFICHSLGGLVVKQVIRVASDRNERDARAAELLNRVNKIVFIATPHSGSYKATWLDWLRVLVWPSTATQSLVANNPMLRSLNVWYRNSARARSIRHLVFYETQRTAAGTIVDPGSVDPGLYGVDPVPLDADHISICKPSNQTSILYSRVRDFIAEPAAKIDPIQLQYYKDTAQYEPFPIPMRKVRRDYATRIAFAGLALTLLAIIPIITILQSAPPPSSLMAEKTRVSVDVDDVADGATKSSKSLINVGDFSVDPPDDPDLLWLKIKIERNFVDYLTEKGWRVAHRASTLVNNNEGTKQILGALERNADRNVEVRIRLLERETIVMGGSYDAPFEMWKEYYKSIPELMIFAIGLSPESLERRDTTKSPTTSVKAALLYFEAARAAKARQLDRADSLLDKAIAEDKSFALAYWGKSQVYYALGNTAAGRDLEERADSLDMDHARPRFVGDAINPIPSLMRQLQLSSWTKLSNEMLFKEITTSSYNIALKAWSFHPVKHRLNVILSNADTGSTAQEFRLATKATLAVNGGFFDIDRNSRLTPSGLLISDGKMLSNIADRRKGGSGVVYEKDGAINIDFIDKLSLNSRITVAVQSGPLVVDPGGKNGIRRNDNDRQDRTAVCQNLDGKITIVVITGGLSLFELGEVLSTSESAGGFGCERALNLDGGPSTQVSFELDSKAVEVIGRWKIANALTVSPR
jgi:uncharacterized protein YigE (DUF2233 family)